MKLIRKDGDTLKFEIEERERQMLFRLLQSYPLIPPAHHQLSKSTHREEDQKLLEDALAEQRAKNKRDVETLLKSETRFSKSEHGWRFQLNGAEIEWLLQVINDVRVGSWLILGSPDGPAETLAVLNHSTAPYFWLMEVAAQFQMVLINAMNRKKK